MRFSVPQYITIEDKLIGLLTFRQLFLLLGAFFITFIATKFLPVFFWVIIGFISFGLGIAMGWLRVNGKPLLNQIPEIFEYFLSFSGKKYLWRPTSEITTQSINIPVIKKYFSEDIEEQQEISFMKKIPVQRDSIKESAKTEQKPPSVFVIVPEIKTVPIVSEIKKEQIKPKPLSEYIQNAHKHSKNPFNPYRHFPLPHFPSSKI